MELETLNDKVKRPKEIAGMVKVSGVFSHKPSDNLKVIGKFHKLSSGNERTAACFITPANPCAKMSVGAGDYEP